MTPDAILALSRKVAEAHEPEPTWTHFNYVGHLSSLSDGGFWISDGGLFWRSIEEPEIAMRLLNELVAMCYVQLFITPVSSIGVTSGAAIEDGKTEVAIAQAWLRAKGL